MSRKARKKKNNPDQELGYLWESEKLGNRTQLIKARVEPQLLKFLSKYKLINKSKLIRRLLIQWFEQNPVSGYAEQLKTWLKDQELKDKLRETCSDESLFFRVSKRIVRSSYFIDQAEEKMMKQRGDKMNPETRIAIKTTILLRKKFAKRMIDLLGGFSKMYKVDIQRIINEEANAPHRCTRCGREFPAKRMTWDYHHKKWLCSKCWIKRGEDRHTAKIQSKAIDSNTLSQLKKRGGVI